MIEVTNISVRTFDLDHLDVFWEIEDTDEELERYSFYLLRSVDGPEGPFGVYAGPFNNSYQFRDPDVQTLHKWRVYYYRIRVVHKDTAEVQEFGPAWLEAPPDRITLEIRRRHYLLLKEFNGRKSFLFKNLTFGQKCPVCWDKGPRGNSIGRPTQQNCETCFDTTYVGGFATPIIFYLQIDPSPTPVQRLESAERAPVDTTGRTAAYPPISPKDVIVEAENIRWEVQRVPFTGKLRAKAHQELVLHQIPRDDVRYAIPINHELLDDFSPEREFTRPMSLGNPSLDRKQFDGT